MVKTSASYMPETLGKRKRVKKSFKGPTKKGKGTTKNGRKPSAGLEKGLKEGDAKE